MLNVTYIEHSLFIVKEITKSQRSDEHTSVCILTFKSTTMCSIVKTPVGFAVCNLNFILIYNWNN
jgi:hypothetical protein